MRTSTNLKSDASEESEEESSPKKRKAEAEPAPIVKKAKTEAATEGGNKNLFVGSLSFGIDEELLTREFEGFGELSGVRIITDRETGRSKGYVYEYTST